MVTCVIELASTLSNDMSNWFLWVTETYSMDSCNVENLFKSFIKKYGSLKLELQPEVKSLILEMESGLMNCTKLVRVLQIIMQVNLLRKVCIPCKQ